VKLIIRPRWQKVLSDLWDNKVRTLLVVFSIAVGVFAVGMIAGTYEIISNDMSASYASTNPANIEIWTNNFDNDLVTAIRNIPGVKEAEGRRFVSVRARIPGQPWISLDMVAQSSFPTSPQDPSMISQAKSIEGQAIPGENEVLLEQDTLEDLPATLGQEIEFQLSDGTSRSMPYVGLVQDQSTNAGNFMGSPLGYMTYHSLERMHEPKAYNRLWVTVTEGSNDEAAIRAVSDQVRNKIEKSGRVVYRTQLNKSNEHPMASIVQAVLGILGLLGVLIVFLSSSLIANTLSGLLNQHTRFIGVMKLVGGRSRQILAMYMVLILAFSAIALVIAIPLGAQAAYALSSMIASMLNFSLLGFRPIPFAVLLQVVIAVTIPLAAGFLPIYNGSRVTVQRAISGYNPPSGQNKPEPEKPGRSIRWISRPLLISLRNTFRRKGRLALTLFTLTMGGAIFIAVFNVRVALNQHLENVSNYFLADVVASFDRPYRVNEINQTILEVPGVQAVEGWAFASAEITHPDGSVVENLQLLAPPANSQLVKPILVSGRWIMPGDGKAIAVSESLLEIFPDLKPGDLIPLKVAGTEELWTVVGIFKFVGGQGNFGYTGYDTLSEMLGLAGRAFSYRIALDDHSEEAKRLMSTTIDAYLRAEGYNVSEVEPGSNSMKIASEGLDTLIVFLLIMAVLTALVGSMGLTGTMGMNVMERTREIGVMRSIGAVDRVVVKTVIIEGMLIGTISWFLGALLSFPITSILSTIISLAIFQTQIEVAFTPEGFLIWLGLVLLLSAVASVLPARSAARLTIREVLAYE
jgi:putative ABC transport system permease protein